MMAIVIYPNELVIPINVPDDKCDSHFNVLRWLWDETQGGVQECTGKESVIDVLRVVNEMNNHEIQNLRSSMVGDLIIIENRFYMVNGSGWVEISLAQFLKLQNMDSRDRCMGWKWLEERLGLGRPINHNVGGEEE